MGERQFRIDTYASSKGVSPTPMSLVLDELYALLEHEETDCQLADGSPGCIGKQCSEKDGLAWSGGFIDDPCRCGTGSRSSKKTKRCSRCDKKTRFKDNADGIDVAIYDVDHIDAQQLEAMELSLVSSGIEFYLHSTHNHLPPNDQSFRLIFPLARTVTPVEWKQIWFAIVRKFNLPTVKDHGVDPTTRDSIRLAFFPRAFRGKPFVNVRNAGQLLDPRELLLENIQHSRQAMRAPAARVEPHEAGSIDLKDLKGYLRRYDPDDDDQYDDTPERQKSALIQRIVDDEPLAEKGCRGLSTLRAGTIVGWLLPIFTPVEAALEMVRVSVSKMETFDDDKEETDSVDAWLANVQRGFEGAQAEKVTRISEEQSATGKLVASIERKRAAAGLPPRLGPPGAVPLKLGPPPAAPTFKLGPPPAAPAFKLGPPPADPPVLMRLGPPPAAPSDRASSTPAAPQVDDKDDAGDWRLEKLITVPDKQGVPHPKNTAANITIVLENHSAWKGALKFNTLTQEPEAHGGPIPQTKRDPDRLVLAIRNWLTHNEELDLPRFEVADHVEFVARECSYDPIQAYLDGLVWDGVPRIDSWLIDYCRARTKTDDGKDVTDYVRMVGAKWLMAGAARGLYPGCKADNVLVFEGEQYAGKSKTLDILGGEFFADTQLDLHNKSTLELTCKSWIIELSELSSMKKTETEAQKSFFSKRMDNFRLSYARRVGKFYRRCVFAGTTNATRYLLDPTGNRRFWSIWCEILDIIGIRRDRDQIWAEAVARVRAGETCPNCSGIDQRCSEHRWWLDIAQTALAEEVAISRLKDEYVDEIREWWLNREKKDRPTYLTVSGIIADILELPIDRQEQLQTPIGRALKILGFERSRVGTERRCIYTPPKEFMEADRSSRITSGGTRLQLLHNIAHAKLPDEGK